MKNNKLVSFWAEHLEVSSKLLCPSGTGLFFNFLLSSWAEKRSYNCFTPLWHSFHYYFETPSYIWNFITWLFEGLTGLAQNKKASPSCSFLFFYIYMCVFASVPSLPRVCHKSVIFPHFFLHFSICPISESFSRRTVMYVKPAAVHTISVMPSAGKPVKGVLAHVCVGLCLQYVSKHILHIYVCVPGANICICTLVNYWQ